MKKIFDTIEKEQMIFPGMRIIAGVSGGADSVCLLYVLSEYRRKVPFEIQVVHVEHGIRGEESLKDAEFTKDLCRKLGVPCRVVHRKVTELAREQGISVEEAGRMERYRIFEELCCELGADRIAVAHNENDQAETVLWNLARGSGLRGLGGIRPVRGRIIRPLLCIGRAEIEAILREAGLTWRTDRTNLEDIYTRNRIRLNILPEMENNLNEQAVRHIAQAAQKLQQVQSFVDQMVQKAAKTCIFRIAGTGNSPVLENRGESEGAFPGELRIRIPEFQQQEELIQRELLRSVMEQYCPGLKDVGSVHVEALLELTGKNSGSHVDLPGGIWACRVYEELRFGKRSRKGQGNMLPEKEEGEAGTDCCPVTLIEGRITECQAGPWKIRAELLDNSRDLLEWIQEEKKSGDSRGMTNIGEKKCTKLLSYDTINQNLLFRKRQPGDYLIVNEEGGRKKLKDYFIDQKIPRELRERMWLLADGSHILWIPGYRISQAARVLPETRKVIRIKMEESVG